MLVTDLSLHREFELSTQAQPSNDTFNDKHIARDLTFCTDVGNGAWDKRNCIEDGACFAAGTLVHTKEGLVPIEQIKVGDWVLSKPEKGGEQAYKRVVKTFAHEPTTVMRVGYSLDEDKNRAFPIVATLNHLFWVVEEGWTAAGDLPRKFYRDGTHLELFDGSYALVNSCGKLYTTDQPNIGWSPSHMGDVKDRGSLWDYANNRLLANGEFAIDTVRNEELSDPYLKLPVYNLEVEEFHTYYVGKHGVWVHNTNCGGFAVRPPGPELTREMTARVAPINPRNSRYE